MPDRIEVGPPVRLGARPAGVPVRTGWNAISEPIFAVDELDDLDDVVAPPGDLGVLTREVAGEPARFRPPTVPARHVQTALALRWQIIHNLGWRPHFVIHDSDGRLVMPENIEHPVPGSISEVVFGAPFAGTADSA